MHGKHQEGQFVEVPEQQVRGCGLLRPHASHDFTTRTSTFTCPGVASAPEVRRQAAEDLVRRRAESAGRQT